MRRAWLVALAFSLTAHAALVVVCVRALFVPARVEVASGDAGDLCFRVGLVEVAPRDEPAVEPQPALEIVLDPDPADEIVMSEALAEPEREPVETSTRVESETAGAGVWAGPVTEPAPAEPASGNGALSVTQAELRSQRNRPPVYPAIARRMGWEGTVVLEVEVLADGRVGGVAVACSSGHEVLDRAAAEAVRCWLFEPAERLGVPVQSAARLPVRFQLVSP